MFSDTNRVCASEASAAASYRVEPGVSLISRSNDADSTVICWSGADLPYTSMTIQVVQACTLNSCYPPLSSGAILIIYEACSYYRYRQDEFWRVPRSRSAFAGG